MPMQPLNKAPKDATIIHTGHTQNGKFGNQPFAQARGRGTASKLDK